MLIGTRRTGLALAALALPLLLDTCSKSGTGPSVATTIAKFSGDAQAAAAGHALAQPLVVRVSNAAGSPTVGATVTFAVLSGAGSVGTPSAATGSNGQAQTTWTLGAAVGSQSVTATVVGATPATFTATAQPGSGPANVAMVVGDAQPGLVGFGVNVRPAVLVTDLGHNPVANATVTFAVQSGGGSVTGGTVTTNAAGIAQVGKWTLGASAGVNTVTASVSGAGVFGNPVSFSDTGLVAGYTIQIQYFGPTPSATVQAAMSAAVAKWQRLIYRPIGAIQATAAAGACGTGTPAINQTVTNLLIVAKFDSIDGPGKVLGQAGPCLVRNSNGLTAVGVMEFDTADIATMIGNGSLNSVMLHEMGHVIGFGTLWDNPPNNCLQLSSTPPGTINDTYFSCPKARAAFDSIGGTSYTGASLSPPGGNRVPVENCGASSPASCGAGTVNGHWREPVFTNELMTGYINSGANPLSVMSVAAQEDLGYTVNYDGADAYAHTFTAPPAGGVAPLSLGDDIRHGPIYVVDAMGRVVGSLRR
jgi:hypothetical protein